MDQVTREAVQAYYRLFQTTQAVTGSTPGPPNALQLLPLAAVDANEKLAAAGLLEVGEEEFEQLVRELYPGFQMSSNT